MENLGKGDDHGSASGGSRFDLSRPDGIGFKLR